LSPIYVYGLIPADTALAPDLTGLGSSGRVSTITHGRVAAVVSDVPDRPLGTRDDLMAHEAVVDSLAATATVIPMRFPAVVEESGVVDDLLAPNHDHFVTMLDELAGRVQYTLRGSYENDVVLREVVDGDEEIQALQTKIRELPEDAAYYDRIRLGELVVGALERMRGGDAEQILNRLEPASVGVTARQPAVPEEVVNAAFLVDREVSQEFEEAVEQVGRDVHPRVRLRLLGPLAPYDFVPEG
jgi:Gas vesicle synthesis protein GvpL/GvpF